MNLKIVLLLISILPACFCECDVIYENKCINIHGHSNYSKAVETCHNTGGRLVVIDSIKKMQLINEKSSDLFWVHLSDNYEDVLQTFHDEGGYVWIQHEPNEPCGGKTRCPVVHYGEHLYCGYCVGNLRFICEKELRKHCDYNTLSLPKGSLKIGPLTVTLPHGYSLNYKCFYGYISTDETMVKCTNGNWEISGHCRPVCKKPGLSEDVIMLSSSKNFYEVGEEVELKCGRGFFIEKNKLTLRKTIKCVGRLNWIPNPVCYSFKHFFDFMLFMNTL